MFKELGSIASLMKNMGNIQGKMGEMSEELKSKQVVGIAGGGMVEVTANGLGQILSVKIDPTLVEKNELEMIQDLLPAAINDAIVKGKQLHVESMQDITGAIPGLDKAMAQMTGAAENDDTKDE